MYMAEETYTRTVKYKIYPVGTPEDQKAFWRFLNKNSEIQVQAKQFAYNYLLGRDHFKDLLIKLEDSLHGEDGLVAEKDRRIKELYSELYKVREDKSLSDEKRLKKENSILKTINTFTKDKERATASQRKGVDKIYQDYLGLSGSFEFTRAMQIFETEDGVKGMDKVDKKTFIHIAKYYAELDYKTDLKKGLRFGRVNSRQYKQNGQLLLDRDHTVSTRFEKEDVNRYYWNFCGYKLRIDMGRKPSRNYEIRATLDKIISKKSFSGMAKLENDGRKLYLSIPIYEDKQEVILDESRVMGVDLGIDIPAYAAFNFAPDWGRQFGDKKYLLDFKTSIKNQRKRYQQQMIFAKGNNKKRSAKLEGLKSREANFTKTFNHVMSKQIVDHAIKNKCGVIRLEDLRFVKDKKESKILANWTYHQLQSFIEMKASRYGVKVQYVDARNTSKQCHNCKHIKDNFAPGNRDGKDGRQYHCENCGMKMNCDHNAAINIAFGTPI